MHARGLDFCEGHDAACQLTFESTLVIDLFLEIRKPEIRPVEYLKADTAAFRQSLACKLDPDFSNLVSGYLDGSSVGFQFVGNFQLLQLLNNALCFLRIEIGIKRLILDTIDEINEHPQQDQNHSGRTGQSQFLLKAVAGEERLDLFERIWSSHSRLPILGSDLRFH